MNKRKLRRVAIVALVLVLLCNTLGVQAETGAPAVTVQTVHNMCTKNIIILRLKRKEKLFSKRKGRQSLLRTKKIFLQNFLEYI